MKTIIYWLFGKRVEGEKLQPPKCLTTSPDVKLSFNEWSEHIFKKIHYEKVSN